MFSLLLLAIALGAVAASAYAAANSPIPTTQALPVACMGLAWRRVGERNTRNGAKTLWRSEPADTSQFQRAYAGDRENMRTVGFSWDDRIPVCWESIPPASDDEVLAVVAAAESKAAAIQEHERVERLQEADRDWLENGAERAQAIARLRACLDGKPWAWTKRKKEWAVAIVEYPDRPTERAARIAGELVDEVESMIAAVIARLGSERIMDWLERAALPEVRVAVLEACRVLSSYDEDFAALRNGVGWSAAHSHVGHVVASLPELDQTQASHALRAVWAHRRQISPEFRGRVFGSEAV
ncbi:hypothetical protein MKK64_05265 [Methylobacterium sp. E-025]|jgi:hypothetical protein|uniref:hypothetical protein n=1 Tax=unclassified Methylobacterium TaxID=2615210 RepID=UPI001FBC0CF3|nr:MULTISPECIES: hypothetical protein [unclassified Methylobacterium]MCJ2039877.1 hypothetical protein [Methylobacterium sp. J-059]MCJ2110614.1 hypothetical protein [Methylobacterium sp. E-025]